MSSEQPESSSPPTVPFVPYDFGKLVCQIQDPTTGKECGKKYSTPFNLRRHYGRHHSATASQGQSTDSETDADDSYDDFDDDVLVGKSVSESRRKHSSSAPPMMITSSHDDDGLQMGSYPLPAPPAPLPPSQTLPSESAHVPPAFDIDTSTKGLNVADAWLIDKSMAPRSHPAGWNDTAFFAQEHHEHTINDLDFDFNRQSTPAQQDFGQQIINQLPPNSSILTPPEFGQDTASIQDYDQIINQLSPTPGQSSAPMPHFLSQILNQVSRNASRASTPIPQEFSQGTTSIPQNIGQILNRLSRNASRSSTPAPQSFNSMPQSSQILNHLADINRMSSPVTQQFSDQIMSPIPQHAGPIMNYLNNINRTSSPTPQDFSRMASPISQIFNQPMTPFPYDFSSLESPVLQDFSGPTTPLPYDFSSIAPVSQSYPTAMSVMPQAFGQTMSPLPAYSGSIQDLSTFSINPTQSFGEHQNPLTLDLGAPSLTAATVQTTDSMLKSGIKGRKRKLSDGDTSDAITTRKSKLSHDTASRPLQALNRDLVPDYPCKESKKFPGQQRGIDWLKKEAKAKFENFHRNLLAQWGVREGHTGTCVLVPEGYRSLEPLDIMARITNEEETYAAPGTPRAFFSMYDHGTTVARALAWFGKWPRPAAWLDQFIACGPWAPMDASHLCHHDHCIVHLTYEAADVNVSRTTCYNESRRLRQQNAADVPESCLTHDPPCMMQVSQVRVVRSKLTFLACCAYHIGNLSYSIRRSTASQGLKSRASCAKTKALLFQDVRDEFTLHFPFCPSTAGVINCRC